MDFLKDLKEFEDCQIEKIFKKLSPETIVFSFLAMDDDDINFFRTRIPFNMIEENNKIMMKLKNKEYEKEDVIKKVKVSLKEFEKEYNNSRIRKLFKERKIEKK